MALRISLVGLAILALLLPNFAIACDFCSKGPKLSTIPQNTTSTIGASATGNLGGASIKAAGAAKGSPSVLSDSRSFFEDFEETPNRQRNAEPSIRKFRDLYQ